MDKETREVYSNFIVGDVVENTNYVINRKNAKTGKEESINIDKDTFYKHVLHENTNVPIDIAMQKK